MNFIIVEALSTVIMKLLTSLVCIASAILILCVNTCETCDKCHWETWQSWSLCCHQSTSRERGGSCHDADSIYDCAYRETLPCDVDCYNGGYSSHSVCSCPDHSFGGCCQHSE